MKFNIAIPVFPLPYKNPSRNITDRLTNKILKYHHFKLSQDKLSVQMSTKIKNHEKMLYKTVWLQL